MVAARGDDLRAPDVTARLRSGVATRLPHLADGPYWLIARRDDGSVAAMQRALVSPGTTRFDIDVRAGLLIARGVGAGERTQVEVAGLSGETRRRLRVRGDYEPVLAADGAATYELFGGRWLFHVDADDGTRRSREVVIAPGEVVAVRCGEPAQSPR